MADVSLIEIMNDARARKWGGMTRRERFAAQCAPTESGCIEHNGWRDKDGYPMVSYTSLSGKVGRRASHIALAMIGQEVPAGQQVNHHCDNRLCVNTDHLFIGSQKDNVKDMVKKRRHSHGDRHSISRLTEDAVRDIRANCLKRGEVKHFAEKYGVTQSAVYAVRCRQNWAHIS